MKIAAGVIGIVAGLIGIAGGFATVFIGAVGEAVEATDAATVTNLGVVAFWVSFIVIVLGIVAFFKPKASGIGMVICGVITLIASNYFSGPLVILGGVFGILDKRFRKSQQSEALNLHIDENNVAVPIQTESAVPS